MSDTTTTTIKYVSFDNLQLYDTLLKEYMSAEDAKSLKTVALSEDGKKLLFYRVSEPVGETTPAYEIELPETDLTGLMPKIANATNGNIGIFQDGTIVDSGKALADVATIEYVDRKVVEGVAGASALTKQIVTQVPTAEDAIENVIYLLKVSDAVGDDKYEEYTLIGGEVVMIGTTSTDLTDYETREQTQAKIDAAKQAAIDSAVATAATDATTKADKALADSKLYTDQEIGEVETRVTEVEGDITTIEDNVTTINNTVTTHGDRLTALEQDMNAIETATEEDIRGLFA